LQLEPFIKIKKKENVVPDAAVVPETAIRVADRNNVTVQPCIFLPAIRGQEAWGVRLMKIQSKKFL
jgi:hypothetical protein